MSIINLPYYCYIHLSSETLEETVIAHVLQNTVADPILGQHFLSKFRNIHVDYFNSRFLLESEIVNHVFHLSSILMSEHKGMMSHLLTIDDTHTGILNLQGRKLWYLF